MSHDQRYRILIIIRVISHFARYLPNSASEAANYQNTGSGTMLRPLVDLSILRLADQIDLIFCLCGRRPMPSLILLSYREACDSEVLGDIVYHQNDEPQVGHERNDKRGQNKQIQAPWGRLNYWRAGMERKRQASTPRQEPL